METYDSFFWYLISDFRVFYGKTLNYYINFNKLQPTVKILI